MPVWHEEWITRKISLYGREREKYGKKIEKKRIEKLVVVVVMEMVRCSILGCF